MKIGQCSVETSTKSAIQDGFEKFLIDSQDEEERRYIDIQEQINEELIHEHYISQKDIEFCLDYDIMQLSEQPNDAEIEKIFEKLKTEYAHEEEANA